MIVIVMGVSGSGKTTVGQHLAQTMNCCFIEGDELHPEANVAKMSRGIPLSDSDRWPWLHRIRQRINNLQQQRQSAVISCSALKQSYREVLQADWPEVIRFVYLRVSSPTLKARLKERQNHFMKVQMLDSQLETLEEPESAITIDVDDSTNPHQVVTQVYHRLAQYLPSSGCQ
ncbi:MAG: gluconokinase [Leptolyngbyaceae cyanobacterium]